jgi:two-component sensor histidine kinase/PAS domain-containing protein
VIEDRHVELSSRRYAGNAAARVADLRKALSSHEPWWRYLASVLIFLVAVITRTLLDNALPPGLPFLTFFPAILANTYLIGLAGGIATLLASAVAADYWWLNPTFGSPGDTSASIALIAFLLIGALNILIVHLLREERERSRALAASTDEIELRLKTALTAAHLATWEYDFASGAIVWDGPLRQMFDLPEGQEPSSDFFFSIVHPEDRGRLRQLRERSLAGDESGLASEFRVTLKDGAIRWLQIEGAFLPGPRRRAAGVARDITRRKLADEQMLLVTAELKHRMRNLFAVVGSIFQQTLRAAAVPDNVAATVSGRLSALARAQELLTLGGGDRGADLAQLMRNVVAPLVPGRDQATPKQRFAVAGPSVTLPPDVTTSFALVVHELATNALKYGAWSGKGSVSVRWRIETPAGQGRQLEFLWREVDGPPVAPPVREGLGTTLIRKALPAATIEHRLNASGLECSIRLPLDASAGAAGAAVEEAGHQAAPGR